MVLRLQASLLEEYIKPRTDLPHLLIHLRERRPEKLHYIGVSFGLTLDLFRFWRRHKFAPFYIGQIPVEMIFIFFTRLCDVFYILGLHLNILSVFLQRIRVLWLVNIRVWSWNLWTMMILIVVDQINGASLNHFTKVSPFFLTIIFFLSLIKFMTVHCLTISSPPIDFRLRFTRLLGLSFRAMEYKLAMRLVLRIYVLCFFCLLLMMFMLIITLQHLGSKNQFCGGAWIRDVKCR